MPCCDSPEILEDDERKYYCKSCCVVDQARESLVHQNNFDDKPFTARTLCDKKPTEKTEGNRWQLVDGFEYILACMTKQLILCCGIADLRWTVLNIWLRIKSSIQLPASIPPAKESADGEEECDQSDGDPEPSCSKFLFERCNPEEKAKTKPRRRRRTLLVDTPDSCLRKNQIKLKRSKKRKASAKDNNTDCPSVESPKIVRRTRFNDDDLLNLVNTDEIKRIRKSRTIVRDPEYLTLAKLVCNLYAALLVRQDLVGPGDVIRWIRQRYIPYFNAHLLLPNSMRISGRDPTILGSASKPTLPSRCYIREHTFKLLSRIGVCEIYTAPVHLLAEKLIEDLQLPSELVQWVKNLEMFVCKNIDWRRVEVRGKIPNVDAYAASFILVVMKLLLGLDGFSEIEVSGYADRLNQILGCRPSSGFGLESSGGSSAEHRTQFVWRDWVRYTEYKNCVLRKVHIPTAMNSGDILNADADSLKAFSRNGWRLSRSRTPLTRQQENQEIVRENVNKALDDILGSVHDDSERVSVDFQPSLLPTRSLVKQLLENDPVRFELLDNRFPDSTFQFIVDPESMEGALHDADPCVQLNFCPNSHESSMRRFKLYKPFYGSWKVNRDQVNEEQRCMELGDSLTVDVEIPLVECGCAFEEGTNKIHVPSHDYWTLSTMYMDRSSFDDWNLFSARLPTSFLWFLNILSEMIEEQPKILYSTLSSLESVLFPRHAKVLHTLASAGHLKMRYDSAQKTELNKAYFGD